MHFGRGKAVYLSAAVKVRRQRLGFKGAANIYKTSFHTFYFIRKHSVRQDLKGKIIDVIDQSALHSKIQKTGLKLCRQMISLEMTVYRKWINN